MHRQRSRAENKSQNLTSVPASIVEQTLALYYITVQRSRASASANILSFWSELGCPQKCTHSCFASLVMFSPYSGFFSEIRFVRVLLWSLKNGLGNKVLAELNVKHRRFNKSHKLRRYIFYIGRVHIVEHLLPMRSCLKPPEACFKILWTSSVSCISFAKAVGEKLKVQWICEHKPFVLHWAHKTVSSVPLCGIAQASELSQTRPG